MSEDRRVKCAHCGAVLGVYEPIVVGEGPHARETSIAAEPELRTSRAPLYHAACSPAAAG